MPSWPVQEQFYLYIYTVQSLQSEWFCLDLPLLESHIIKILCILTSHTYD